MNKFKTIVENRHEYAQKWKDRTGGMVVGYIDPYFPEEIAYAAGMLPLRIIAEHQPDEISTKWIYGSCYPVRDMVNLFLKGLYDYLDALVYVESCQWMFNAFEVIMHNKPELRTHYLFLPDYINAPTSKTLLRSELNVLKNRFEEWTGNKITAEALDNAIDIYNKNRQLLRQLYQLRRAERPYILGSEAMNIILADQVMDKAEMNEILESYLEELQDREPYEDRIRLMLIGSETWEANLEKMVEDLGGNVVIDELDNGSSYCWNDVVSQRDQLMAIALRYLDRPHSALKDNNWRRRSQHIFELAEDYAVDGAMIAKQIYCHPHGTDNYEVWKILRERKIPFHYFERDMSMPEDETKIRLEAFLNILKPGLVRLVV